MPEIYRDFLAARAASMLRLAANRFLVLCGWDIFLLLLITPCRFAMRVGYGDYYSRSYAFCRPATSIFFMPSMAKGGKWKNWG